MHYKGKVTSIQMIMGADTDLDLNNLAISVNIGNENVILG